MRPRLFAATVFIVATLIGAVQTVAAAPIIVGFDRFSDGAAGVSPGLLLYSELKCNACHGLLTPTQSAFPPRTAPNLQGAAERTRFHYLQSFIADPHDVKPGTTMPDLLAGMDEPEAAEASEALAHFLLSLGGAFQADNQPPEAESLERGKHLYHTTGCVACHAPTEPPESGASDDIFADTSVVEMPEIAVPSVPLPDLAQKTSATALADFLLDPGHARPGGRMPNMTLTESEATAIANWLVRRTGVPPVIGRQPASHDPAKAEHGRALFQTLGCAACHELEDTNSVPAAPSLGPDANWTAGCLAEAPTARAPWFDLDNPQRAALAALKDQPRADQPTPADIISHTVLALNCYACHERNGLGGPEPGRAAYFTETEELDLGDEGRLPPALTGVGAKLTPEWLRDILTDKGRIRPYMATRMPHFTAEHVAALVPALLEVDHNPQALETNVSGLEHHHRNHYGRELMGVNGLGCVTCHVLDGHRSLGIPAVDLANVPRRLQPSWFLEYMLEPASLRPQTRMPDFFDGNKSLSSKLFGGDARKQIEALWIYLKEVKETRLPDGMEDAKSYELIPTDRPLVHRTFIEGVGTHAIAVGFPGGLNFAYDVRAVRPALVWRGRFIDAESAQADRFVPFVKPLGEDVVALPAGVQCAPAPEGPWTAALDTLRYRGYHLDAARVPAFRYSYGNVLIEETIQPDLDGKSLVRRLTFTGPSKTLYLRLGPGEAVAGPDNTYQIGKLTIRLTKSPSPTAGPTDIGWVIPIAVTESGTTIEEVLTW